LLLEACSLPHDPRKIAARAAQIRDTDSLFRLAEEHGVIAHLARALGESANSPVLPTLIEELRARHRGQLLFTLAMTAELFRILALFKSEGIQTVVVKGPVLSLRAYGDPAARQYVDLDLLLRHSDIQRATEIVVAAGYESKVPIDAIRAGKVPGEYLFRRPGTKVIFELHTERTFRYFPRPLPLEKFLAGQTALSLDGHPVPALSAEDEFVLISIHGGKHFWERLMWISDIAAMVHNHPELDWTRIRHCAADVGAERMVRVALLLAARLLRTQIPPSMAAEIQNDLASTRLVSQIEAWLPYSGYAAPPLVQRALFRFRMRGSFLAGAGYLSRLSFSTTEEDWTAGGPGTQSRIVEILRRPLRLARKYRRSSQ